MCAQGHPAKARVARTTVTGYDRVVEVAGDGEHALHVVQASARHTSAPSSRCMRRARQEQVVGVQTRVETDRLRLVSGDLVSAVGDALPEWTDVVLGDEHGALLVLHLWRACGGRVVQVVRHPGGEHGRGEPRVGRPGEQVIRSVERHERLGMTCLLEDLPRVVDPHRLILRCVHHQQRETVLGQLGRDPGGSQDILGAGEAVREQCDRARGMPSGWSSRPASCVP